MKGFHYVYILQSIKDPSCYYTGQTEDLKERLAKHNSGNVPHTNKFKPWTIKAAIALRDKLQATALERYLKTASGRAFAKRRL